MNSVRISICLFVLFPSNFASASLKLSELPPSDDETPSAKHPIDPSGIDQHYAIIMQLQSGINLLAMELESIKHRLNHTKADSNRHQWDHHLRRTDWSRLVAAPRGLTYAPLAADALSPPPTRVDPKYIKRSPRSPNNKRHDNRVQPLRTSHSPPPGARNQLEGASTLIERNGADGTATTTAIEPSCDRNCLDGLPGLDGAPGLDGVPGADGRNGRDGLDGKDGRDGKDGGPGERGPAGPAGPPGEPGRRGRPGPPGKMGPPGPAGVCVYQAKYDCSPLTIGGGGHHQSPPPESSNTSLLGQPQPQLLMAPTMVGETGGAGDGGSPASPHHHQHQHSPHHHPEPPSQRIIDERQVSVNEGDNIQLSCEAFGLPRPVYVWRRSDKRSATILLEAQSGLRVSSFAGGQLPLARVDRLQAGSYECVASNGVPPSASKRISLDINYKPTVRLLSPPLVVGQSPQGGLRHPQKSSARDGRNKNPGPIARPRFQATYGSSVLIECLVEANPSALAYWMFQDELIMSIAGGGNDGPGTLNRAISSSETTSSGNPSPLKASDPGQSWRGSDDDDDNIGGAKAGNGSQRSMSKYIITESTGQLVSGASYTILTLNVTHVERGDTGTYKCVGKNLIDQTVGTIELALDTGTIYRPQQTTDKSQELGTEDGAIQLEQLDSGAGWPSHLLERDGKPSLYATHGAEHRRRPPSPLSSAGNNSAGGGLAAIESMVSSFKQISSMVQESNNIADERQPSELSTTTRTPPPDRNHKGLVTGPSGQAGPPTRPSTGEPITPAGMEPIITNRPPTDEQGAELAAAADDDLELCSFITQLSSAKTASTSQLARNSSTGLLLDQFGKPVYVGQAHQISWWSLDSAMNDALEGAPDRASVRANRGEHHFVTMASRPGELFEYANLADLQRDLSTKTTDQTTGELSLRSATSHRLRYPIYLPGAQLVYEDAFLYITHLSQLDTMARNDESASRLAADASLLASNPKSTSNTLDELVLVKLDIRRNRTVEQLFRMDSDQLILSAGHIFGGELATETKTSIDRHRQSHTEPLNLGSDYKLNRVELMADENGVWLVVPTTELATPSALGRHLVRRLHVINLGLGRASGGSQHHVNMKLDWRMIGQMFIIDGILYGIKDKHSYSSRLLFAYDLYRCKLLPGEYNRAFTNHFGDTQMIKYNPNEPKRLYTIDNGNLLWRPLKLITADQGGLEAILKRE